MIGEREGGRVRRDGGGIILVLSPDLPATNLASTSSEQPWV
jgi:hypothetical protein